MAVAQAVGARERVTRWTATFPLTCVAPVFVPWAEAWRATCRLVSIDRKRFRSRQFHDHDSDGLHRRSATPNSTRESRHNMRHLATSGYHKLGCKLIFRSAQVNRKADLACKSASITFGEFCCTAISEKSAMAGITADVQEMAGELGSGSGAKAAEHDAKARHQPQSKWIGQ